MPLTNAALKNAQPAEKAYKLSDGRGLYVLITPSGGKLFRQKYRFQGKEMLLAIGPYPEFSLQEARDRSEAARKLLRDGQDPAALKQLDKLKQKVAAATTFEEVAREWMAEKAKRQKPHHNKAELRRLEIDAFPIIGKRPIAHIESAEVLAVLRRIEDRGAPEMRTKVRQLASQVFRYGIVTLKCKNDPIPALKGAFQAHEVRHMPAIDEKELPELLLKIDRFDGEPTTRLALFFMAHTFLRTQEMIKAEWSEIDVEAKLWTVPAVRMKPSPRMRMAGAHLVPLTDSTIRFLEELRALNGDYRWVFAGRNPRKHISTNTIIYALYRMGYEGRMTGHGFRSVANTVLEMQTVAGTNGDEVPRFNRDWIEVQLAHAEKNQVRAAYSRADYLPQRTRMMGWWSKFLEETLSKAKGAISQAEVGHPSPDTNQKMVTL
jgi:integrase